ncbi:unnamed protein product [Lymnaea stagnalis]|uniref:Ig-like domain-containing protein n=1 Tax=Lymnaea stagnalis TaxID=6523 RepID=A0AAV2I0J9_LYMST
MTAMAEDVDDRFAGIDIDSLLNRTERRPFTYGRKKCLYEAPEFIQRLNGEETVLEGQSLCIECKVAGFPAPALRWFKDDEEILDHPRIHVESNGKGAYCLMIDNVNKGDEAAYRCRAENVEGASSCCFFLSVKGKPKSPKKKDGKSPNRRTVSFPPMFATIVEKVEEEEKQGKELKELPPSPMTEFYYALTLKSRQSWPTFVGDWAFVDGGHHEKRRTDSDERETKSAPTTPVSNGKLSDKGGLFLNAREVNGKGVNRGQLKEMTKETKKRLDEEAARREKENAAKRDQEKVAADKKREENKKKVEAEEKIEEEQRKREDAMKLRRKTREDRRERDRKVKEEEEKKAAVKGDVTNKVNDGKSETFENKERLMREEENKKKEALVKEEEMKRKEMEVEQTKKKDAQMIEDEKRKKEAGGKEDKRIKKEEKFNEDKNKDVEQPKRLIATKIAHQIKPLEEERQQKLKKESDIKRLEEERQQKLKKESEMKRLEEERQQKLKKESDMKRLEEERQQKLKKESEMKRLEEERQQKLKKESDLKRLEEERQHKLKKESEMKRLEEERQHKLKKESDMKRLEEERQHKLKKESDMKRLEEERQQKLKKETNDSRAGRDSQETRKPTPSPAPPNTEQATSKRVPAALQVFKDKESYPTNTREKSPFKTQDTKEVPNIPISLVSHKLEQQNQEKQQARTNYKATDIPKDTERATEKVSVGAPHEQKDQPKDIRTQPLDATRQREKEQIDSMKQREQTQIEKLRERERQQIGALRQREQNQIDALRQREKEQIEALRKRQQEQRDATDQREKKQSSGIKEMVERPNKGEKRPQTNPPDVKQSERDAVKVTKEREDLKLREQQQIDELRAKEQGQRDALRLKERKQIHDLHRHEEQQKEEFRLKEIKLKEDLRSKQPHKQVEEEARKKEEERKKTEQRAREEKEEKQMEVRKEQIRKEQLRRQYEEDTRKRQAKLKAEDEMRRNERDKAERSCENGEQEGKNDDESQIKVHKRDYSFSELRQSLESHLGGEVMDEEEHKYWNNIMEKHAYSINDIKKAFDSISSEERPSRQRARRNSIEETELLNMKRSSSINDLRESYTKSLGRPKKIMSELQKRQKDEEFLKRASSISDLRHQFLAVVQKQATSSRLLNVPGKQEAEITIRHMKLSDTVRPSEIRQRSKSPTPSPLYAAVSQSTAQNSSDNKPASRTQAELNKLAGAVAAKRASFHEMLAQKGEGVAPEKSQKRMSYQGRDAYGSREISVYKRAAGWSDDIESSPEVNDSQLNSDTCSQASNASSSSFSSSAHLHDTINSSYTTKVRPFVYNSVRTTARSKYHGSSI